MLIDPDWRSLRRKLVAAVSVVPKGDRSDVKRRALVPWRRRFVKRMFARKTRLRSNEDAYLSQLLVGKLLNVNSLNPILAQCASREDYDLYDYFRMWSSFPTLDRPGRRMKFLLRDGGQPGSPLMGLACLSSAVRQLRAREEWIGWSEPKWRDVRARGLAYIMDLSTCVTLPPYSFLTAGKLLAAMMTSNEVREEYKRRYCRRRSVFRRRILKDFVLITTTAGYGSNAPQYKGLSYDGSKLFQLIGYTKGYSGFQIPPKLFDEVKEFVNSRYGKNTRMLCGSNAKFRILRLAARQLGIPEERLLFSGHRRAVFVAPLPDNWKDYLLGRTITPYYYDFRTSEVVQRWKTHWLGKRMSSPAVRSKVSDFIPESLRMSRLLR